MIREEPGVEARRSSTTTLTPPSLKILATNASHQTKSRCFIAGSPFAVLFLNCSMCCTEVHSWGNCKKCIKECNSRKPSQAYWLPKQDAWTARKAAGQTTLRYQRVPDAGDVDSCCLQKQEPSMSCLGAGGPVKSKGLHDVGHRQSLPHWHLERVLCKWN